MKLTTKQMIIPMAAIAVVGAGLFGIATVSAATDTTNPQASLIQKLADTFHVDKSKVQAVFDQQHTENQAAHEAAYEARLTQAVTDGKLTSAQKDLVMQKHKELEAARDKAMAAAKSDTTTSKADRKAAMDKQKADIDAWAKANNIDAKWLMGGGMGGHGGFGGGHGHGMMDGHGPGGDDGATPSPSPSASPSATQTN